MVVGIVAEYNPFHNGHKLQIDYARNTLGADAVVVAMSGPFTQRGEIACFDKYTRAHAALVSGADIILEIPAIFATASAREFAAAGVQLLASTGIVDTILFGAECADVDLFKTSASKLLELEASGQLDSEINSSMAAGESYAAARSKALEKYIPEEIISNPNNILGLEYCRYIYDNKIPMDIAVLKRQGNNYNNTEVTGELSSATAIRKHLADNGDIVAVPKKTAGIYSNSTAISCDDISEMLHYKLLTENDFEKYLDCNSDLSDRIRNNLKDFVSFSQFCDLLKTKNINYSRISRVLCHILLDITQADFEIEKAGGYIRYLRMLGFSKKGSEFLGDIKEKGNAPLITGPTEIIDKHDILASDILRAFVTAKNKKSYDNEYTKKYSLVNVEN